LILQKNKTYPYFVILLISIVLIPVSSIGAQTTDTSASSSGVPCEPGTTMEIPGIPGKIKIDGFTKEKKKGETTVVITKKIDENSPKLEDMLDNEIPGGGPVIIEVCSVSFDEETGLQITTLYTITLELVTIESISQEVNDDGTPGTEKVTFKAKISKSTFER